MASWSNNPTTPSPSQATAVSDCPQCGSVCVGGLLLPCGHLTCRKCLRDHHGSQLTCHTCQHRLPLPKDQGSADFSSLVQQLGVDPVMALMVNERLRGQGRQACLVCENREATTVCQDCNEFYCHSCARMHGRQRMSRDHVMQPLPQALRNVSSADCAVPKPRTNSASSCDSMDIISNPMDQPTSRGPSRGSTRWKQWVRHEVGMLQAALSEQDALVTGLNDVLAVAEKRQTLLQCYAKSLSLFDVTQQDDDNTFNVTVTHDDVSMQVKLDSLQQRLRDVIVGPQDASFTSDVRQLIKQLDDMLSRHGNWSTSAQSSTTQSVGVLQSSTTQSVGVLQSSTTQSVGLLQSSTTQSVGVLQSSTTQSVGVLQSSTTQSSTTQSVGVLQSSTTQSVGVLQSSTTQSVGVLQSSTTQSSTTQSVGVLQSSKASSQTSVTSSSLFSSSFATPTVHMSTPTSSAATPTSSAATPTTSTFTALSSSAKPTAVRSAIAASAPAATTRNRNRATPVTTTTTTSVGETLDNASPAWATTSTCTPSVDPMTARPRRAFSVRPVCDNDSRKPYVTSIISTRDGQRLVMTDSNNRNVKVVDFHPPHKVFASLKVMKGLRCLALLPDSLVAMTTCFSIIYLLKITNNVTVTSRIQTDVTYQGVGGLSDGRLIVSCDRDDNNCVARVDIITRDGNVVTTITDTNTLTRLRTPRYLSVVDSHVLLSDWASDAVYKVDISSGHLVDTLTHPDMRYPRQLTADGSGNVYIASEWSQCVLVRSAGGQWRKLVEASQHSDEGCDGPRGVCLTSDGRLVVAWSKSYSDSVVIAYDLCNGTVQ